MSNCSVAVRWVSVIRVVPQPITKTSTAITQQGERFIASKAVSPVNSVRIALLRWLVNEAAVHTAARRQRPGLRYCRQVRRQVPAVAGKSTGSADGMPQSAAEVKGACPAGSWQREFRKATHGNCVLWEGI